MAPRELFSLCSFFFLNSYFSSTDKTSHDVVEDHEIDGPSKPAVTGPEGLQQHNEVNFVQPELNMEDTTTQKLNSTRTELGRIILLCLTFMRYSCGFGMELLNSL